jgi:hypothetical protein
MTKNLLVGKEITTPHQLKGPHFGNRVALPANRRLTVGRDSRHRRNDILAEGLVQVAISVGDSPRNGAHFYLSLGSWQPTFRSMR